MNEVELVHNNLAPAVESPSLVTVQPAAGVFLYRQRKCVSCGKWFVPRVSFQITCGGMCSYERLKVRMRKRTALRSKKNSESIQPRPCLYCGGAFTPRTIQKQLIYCSKKCKLSARADRRRTPRIELSCVICGAHFSTGVPHRKTCSNKCYRRQTSILFRKRMTKKAIQARVATALRNRVISALKSIGLVKTETTENLCGCSKQFLCDHIEKQFSEGMNWGNRGYWGWHIDHIIPCSSFDLSNLDERKKCFHWSNLQPLWRSDNQQKGNRLDWSPAGL